MKRPEGVTLIFAVVENNGSKTLDDVIAPFREQLDILYELEENLGVPFARNHAIDIAQAARCDFTTFVDDDETVDPLWLTEIYTSLIDRNLDLVGGPVRLHPVEETATRLQKLIWTGLVRRNHRVEKTANKERENGTDHKVTVITSNWLIRNSFLTETALRFREDLGFSGGSDTAFFKSARKLGAKTGWASSALVYETMPLSRLSLRYQYKRGRDQSIASFRLKYPKMNAKIVLKSLAFILIKSLAAFILLLSVPFSRGKTLTAAMRSFGFASGRLQALLGKHSTHYSSVHGS